jgi:replication factor C subunit 2/4
MAFNFFKIKKQNDEEQKIYSEPFHEKYRPKKLLDIIGQEDIVTVLSKSITGSDMPHLLFYGPPGSGKSSTIKSLCNELYGNQSKDYVLHLNASDERGISIVRDKIKNFAQFGSTTRKNGIPFKIIILDEADNITDDAQTALRRTMEIYSRATRFCLICNHITNINHPLRSRCAIFRFKSLISDNIVDYVEEIAKKENMIFDAATVDATIDNTTDNTDTDNVDTDNIDTAAATTADVGTQINEKKQNALISTLVKINNGDFRKILTQLEALKKLYANKTITLDNIYENARIIPYEYITELTNTDDFDHFIIKLNEILLKGYSGIQLLYQLFDYFLQNNEYSDIYKKLVINKISLCELRMVNGSDELIQLTGLFSAINQKLVI